MTSDSWWRFYNTAPDHPKILRLTDAQFRGWAILNSLASKMGGVIPDDMVLIAMALRKTAAKALDLVTALLAATLLDRVEGGYAPHNWNEKQFKSDVSTERVKRFREKKRNVSETDQRQSTETETETEKKESIPRAPSRFGEFWDVCPKKVGKAKAQTLFDKAAKHTSPDLIITAMRGYATSRVGEDAQYTVHPATWLFQRRWEDQEIPGVTVLKQNAFNSPEELENQRRQYEEAYGKKAPY